jgi:hypothetical protein
MHRRFFPSSVIRLTLFLAAAGLAVAHAQDASFQAVSDLAPGTVLKVDVHDARPFAIHAQDNTWHGLG